MFAFLAGAWDFSLILCQTSKTTSPIFNSEFASVTLQGHPLDRITTDFVQKFYIVLQNMFLNVYFSKRLYENVKFASNVTCLFGFMFLLLIIGWLFSLTYVGFPCGILSNMMV